MLSSRPSSILMSQWVFGNTWSISQLLTLSQLLVIWILVWSTLADFLNNLVRPKASTGGPCKKVLPVITELTVSPFVIFFKSGCLLVLDDINSPEYKNNLYEVLPNIIVVFKIKKC